MSNATETNTSAPAAALLFIHAQTSLHPGSGTALGVVDLPIQRERHTQWPVIPGSALKGILRDACREKAKESYQDEYEDKQENGQTTPVLKRSRRRVANEDDPLLVAAFGPGKVDESSAHAAAITLTDARILAFPVRSLRDVFAWVTCSAVLERLNRDLALSRQPLLKLNFSLGKEEAVCSGSSPLLVDGNKLVLEEFEFTQTKKAEDVPCQGNQEKKTTKTVAEWVGDRAVSDSDAATAKRIASHLVILHNDDFTHFVRHATEIVARIGLDYERKTVKTGALFYQECLPAETIFYSVVLANASRNGSIAKAPGEILDYIGGRVKEARVLQIGGDETTGKGICGVRLFDGKAGGQ